MAVTSNETKVIRSSMFGTFSMTCDDQVITGKAKSSENQFNYLMQLMSHYGHTGVSKNLIITTLFGDRELNNANHALQSVMYNAKRRLQEFGLYADPFFERRGGVYYWTPKIPIVEDVRDFENMIAEAARAEDREKREELLLSAVHLYGGDFLENQVGVTWVSKENWKYRRMYAETVNTLAGLLKEDGKYDLLENIGKLATQVQPFSNWELLTMESYVSRGMTDQAYDLFEETIDFYQYEQGIKPSNKMYELISVLGEQFEHSTGSFQEIKDHLREESYQTGGYNCSYPVFMGIYQAVNRISERSGQMVYLMLCTIVDTKGNALTKGEHLEELSVRLEEAIRTTIRRSDVMNKYGKGQYLVLLMNTTLENCEIIQRRINQKFMINRQRISVRYYVSPTWQE